MHFYEVNFQSVVSPYRGDLIIPFREITVRKLHKVKGKVRTEGKISCRRLREYVAAAMGNTVFYSHLGPVDKQKGTLSVDALITLIIILLELKEDDFFRKHPAEEVVVDQKFLDEATTSNIRLDQFAEFDHFEVRRTEAKRVPQVVTAHFHYLKDPLFLRVR